MAEPLVSVGLVTWNSAEYLRTFLQGIRRQEYRNLELIVVDNASEDNSVDLIRQEAPGAKVLCNRANLGYCGAHNQAIDLSQGKYYLPINPDVELNAGYLPSLVQGLEQRPGCWSAVGKMWLSEEEPRRLDGTGLFIDRRRHQYLRGFGELDEGQYDQAGEVFGADGAAPLLRREALEDLRIFGQVYDEAFFSYMEDVDLSWRARLFGWKSWYDPAATACHDRTFRPGERRVMSRSLRSIAVKNRYLLLLKNEMAKGWRRDWWRIHFYDLQILVYVLLFEQSSLGAIPLLRDQWQDARAWREEVQGQARVSSEDALTWFK